MCLAFEVLPKTSGSFNTRLARRRRRKEETRRMKKKKKEDKGKKKKKIKLKISESSTLSLRGDVKEYISYQYRKYIILILYILYYGILLYKYLIVIKFDGNQITLI